MTLRTTLPNGRTCHWVGRCFPAQPPGEWEAVAIAGRARPRDVAGNDASGLTNRTVAVLLGHTAYTVDEGDRLQVPSHWQRRTTRTGA